MVLGSVFALSPVLKTLTDSISTDTIYAMTVSTANIKKSSAVLKNELLIQAVGINNNLLSIFTVK